MTVMKINILGKGINLSEIGVNEYAFAWRDIDVVLPEIKKLNLVILGGDVYIKRDDELDLTYDSWYYNRVNTSLDSVLSIDKAREYIYNYIKNNDNDYYFSFILDKHS